MIPTIAFDILDATLDWEEQKILSFDFARHSNIKNILFEKFQSKNQLVDIGYSSFNSIMIL